MQNRSQRVIESLIRHNRSLTDADRSAKYAKMAKSAFRFYRGTNHLFWADFAQDSRLRQFGSPKTYIWIQGDLHTENYGAYANDDGDLVYSLNDFDDATIADYQFDLWRMAVSIVLVARQNTRIGQNDSGSRSSNGIRPNGMSSAQIELLLDAFVETYLDTVTAYRGNKQERRVTLTASVLSGRLEEFLEDVSDRTSIPDFLDTWTQPIADQDHIKRHFNHAGIPEKLAPVTQQERDAIAQQMAHYGSTLSGKLAYDPAHFRIHDIAKRINAGTGSLGAHRYYVLIPGTSDRDASSDYGRILDIKHQQEPNPYRYMAESDRQTYNHHFGGNHAQRHAIAYLALTNNTDDYLGWMQLDLPDHPQGYFSVRELSPYKRSFDATNITTLKTFKAVAANWGFILATAHARSDKDFDDRFIDYSFDKQIDQITKGKHKEFRNLVKAIAFSYADQVQADWQTFLQSDLAPSTP